MTNQLKQENVKDSFYIKKCMAREYKVKVKETSLYLPVVLSVPCIYMLWSHFIICLNFLSVLLWYGHVLKGLKTKKKCNYSIYLQSFY